MFLFLGFGSAFRDFPVATLLCETWNAEFLHMGIDGKVTSREYYSAKMDQNKEKTEVTISLYNGKYPDLEEGQNDTRPIISQFLFKFNHAQSGVIYDKETNDEIIPVNFTDTFAGYLGAYGTVNIQNIPFTYSVTLVNRAIFHIILFSYETGKYDEIILTRTQQSDREPWYFKHNKVIVGVGFFILTSLFLKFSPKLAEFLNGSHANEKPIKKDNKKSEEKKSDDKKNKDKTSDDKKPKKD